MKATEVLQKIESRTAAIHAEMGKLHAELADLARLRDDALLLQEQEAKQEREKVTITKDNVVEVPAAVITPRS